MKPSLQLVKEFHEKFNHPVTDAPVFEQNLNRLRIRLIDEELLELARALDDQDPIKALDALCDLQVVLDGAFLALGYWRVKDAAIYEVNKSNMSKADKDGKPIFREDGKILKGPNYQPPNLEPHVRFLFSNKHQPTEVMSSEANNT